MSLVKKIKDWLLIEAAKVTWWRLKMFSTGKAYDITLDDWFEIREKLNTGYYIILTRRKTHLTTYLTGMAHYFLTGRWGYYSHAVMNVEHYEGDPHLNFFTDFRFVEAIGSGVRYAHWFDVFDCDSVCILKPKYYTQEEFDAAVVDVYDEINKHYDLGFNLNDPEMMSCVELARERMIHLPEYSTRMRVFEWMVQNEKNLTPQMFRECPDFDVVLEIKR